MLQWRFYKPKHDASTRPVQLSSPSPCLESTEVRDIRVVQDCSQYYNAHILPNMVPAHLPFKRGDQAAREWIAAPLILRHLMVVLVKSAQSRQCSIRSSSELFDYRARTLQDLQRSLFEAAEDPYGIVLSAVILLMGIELQYPEFGCDAWLYHFKAAKRIVILRGGFGRTFFGLPHSQGLLLKFMMVDIFSMTICSHRQLDEDSVLLQEKYKPILLLREQSLVAHGHLCPQPLLQSIISTTILRTCSNTTHAHALEDIDLCQSFQSIMSDIMDFDASRWSERVSSYGLSLPPRVKDAPAEVATATWCAHALAFQYAAELYLLLSVRAPPTLRDGEPSHTLTLQKRLVKQIDCLFDIASPDPDAPIETQCWKFALWPTVISIVVNIGWCSQDIEEMAQEPQRLRSIALDLGSSTLLEAASFLSGVAKRRAADLEAIWSWDDVFPTKCAFVAC